MAGQFSLKMRLPRHCRVLLHAAKLRNGTDGFTSPPKEGTLRIFSRVQTRLRPGLNPLTWVPEASMITTRPPKPRSALIMAVNRELQTCSFILNPFSYRSLYTGVCVRDLRPIAILAGHVQVDIMSTGRSYSLQGDCTVNVFVSRCFSVRLLRRNALLARWNTSTFYFCCACVA
jgi:hypothetical protein